MNALWERDEATVGNIVEALGPPKLAYSTVLTTMRTLEAKGYIAHEKQGRAFVYRPIVQRSEAASSLLNVLLERFFAGSASALAAWLVSEKRLSKKDLANLANLIETKRRTKDSQE